MTATESEIKHLQCSLCQVVQFLAAGVLDVNDCRSHVHQPRLIVTFISTASAGATISFRIESVEQVLDTVSSGFSIGILESNPPLFTCHSLA